MAKLVDAQFGEVQIKLISEVTEILLKRRKANAGSNPVLTTIKNKQNEE